MRYALIKDRSIKNIIIVDDESFLSLISEKWDECLRVDQLENQPYIGDSYIDGVFSHPLNFESEE